jgi:hypothetical protein
MYTMSLLMSRRVLMDQAETTMPAVKAEYHVFEIPKSSVPNREPI